MKPACFDDERQYSDWLALFKVSYLKEANVCADCTPSFAGKMRAAKRCENPLYTVPDPHKEIDLPMTSITGPKKGRPPIPVRVVLSR